jgi:hypothetical protein
LAEAPLKFDDEVSGPIGTTEVIFELAISMVTVTSMSWIEGLQKIAADRTGLEAKNHKTTGRNSSGVLPLFGQLDVNASGKGIRVTMFRVRIKSNMPNCRVDKLSTSQGLEHPLLALAKLSHPRPPGFSVIFNCNRGSIKNGSSRKLSVCTYTAFLHPASLLIAVVFAVTVPFPDNPVGG